MFKFRFGWSTQHNKGFGESASPKEQLLNMVRSIRTVLRFPLILINTVVVVKKLILGLSLIHI